MPNAKLEWCGSFPAHVLGAAMALLGATGCVGASFSTYGQADPTVPETADLAVEISALADELTERAGLRIPLGSIRVIIDEPVPIRPKSARFRPVAQGERDRRATQAAVRFELEMAFGNRLNVVGAGDFASGPLDGDAQEVVSVDTKSLAQRAARTGATHAILGTFVRDGDDLDLSIRLVEFDSEWIVATARRKILNFVPDAYDEQFGAPLPVASPAKEMRHTAEIVPVSSSTSTVSGDQIGALDGTEGAPRSFEDPITFDTGPAAARLRALERLKIQPVQKTPLVTGKSQY